MKKKAIYTSPLTTLTVVEMEGQICGASAEIRNPDTDYGRIEDQKINIGFDSDFGGGDDWTKE